jgi:hypothetical protein
MSVVSGQSGPEITVSFPFHLTIKFKVAYIFYYG